MGEFNTLVLSRGNNLQDMEKIIREFKINKMISGIL